MMEAVQRRALFASVGIYLLMSPLGLYNTFAMLGLVEARFVPLQITMTLIMIALAFFASRPIGLHCSEHPRLLTHHKRLWQIGFYVIGPPILYAYYLLLFTPDPSTLEA